MIYRFKKLLAVRSYVKLKENTNAHVLVAVFLAGFLLFILGEYSYFRLENGNDVLISQDPVPRAALVLTAHLPTYPYVYSILSQLSSARVDTVLDIRVILFTADIESFHAPLGTRKDFRYSILEVNVTPPGTVQSPMGELKPNKNQNVAVWKKMYSLALLCDEDSHDYILLCDAEMSIVLEANWSALPQLLERKHERAEWYGDDASSFMGVKEINERASRVACRSDVRCRAIYEKASLHYTFNPWWTDVPTYRVSTTKELFVHMLGNISTSYARAFEQQHGEFVASHRLYEHMVYLAFMISRYNWTFRNVRGCYRATTSHPSSIGESLHYLQDDERACVLNEVRPLWLAASVREAGQKVNLAGVYFWFHEDRTGCVKNEALCRS